MSGVEPSGWRHRSGDPGAAEVTVVRPVQPGAAAPGMQHPVARSLGDELVRCRAAWDLAAARTAAALAAGDDEVTHDALDAQRDLLVDAEVRIAAVLAAAVAVRDGTGRPGSSGEA